MSEELIARLHLPWPKDGGWAEVTLPLWVLELTTEAADRIEELEKACDEWAEVSQSNYQRAKLAEAKLAKAVTELKMLTDVSKYMQSSTSHGKRRHITIITDTLWSQWSKQLRIALKFLAELKGQDDE